MLAAARELSADPRYADRCYGRVQADPDPALVRASAHNRLRQRSDPLEARVL